MKKGVKLNNLRMDVLPLNNEIKAIKLKNIESLLNLYDDEWKNDNKFNFYKNLIENRSSIVSSEDKSEAKNECDCIEEDCGIKI